jgi:hypothetical protein
MQIDTLTIHVRGDEEFTYTRYDDFSVRAEHTIDVGDPLDPEDSAYRRDVNVVDALLMALYSEQAINASNRGAVHRAVLSVMEKLSNDRT